MDFDKSHFAPCEITALWPLEASRAIAFVASRAAVRINPREVHIQDPYFYDEVYAPASRKREKDPDFVGVFGFPTSMIATVGQEHHR